MRTSGERKVLIVEDDPTLKFVWELIFKKLDYSVSFNWINSISELEKRISHHDLELGNYDLVITDIFFPETRSGLEFWMRNEKVLRNKTLIVSSLASAKVRELLGNRSHYPFYLQKPLAVKECIDLLNWIFSHQTNVFGARLRLNHAELI